MESIYNFARRCFEHVDVTKPVAVVEYDDGEHMEGSIAAKRGDLYLMTHEDGRPPCWAWLGNPGRGSGEAGEVRRAAKMVANVDPLLKHMRGGEIISRIVHHSCEWDAPDRPTARDGERLVAEGHCGHYYTSWYWLFASGGTSAITVQFHAHDLQETDHA